MFFRQVQDFAAVKGNILAHGRDATGSGVDFLFPGLSSLATGGSRIEQKGNSLKVQSDGEETKNEQAI
jgi:hypothetical protein